MRKIYLVVAVTAVFLCAVGCNDGGVESGGGDAGAYLTKFRVSAGAVYGPPLNDERDGKVYRTVRIGNQTWMAENLNYDLADGNGSWCYGQDGLVADGLTLTEKEVQSHCKKYGRLYDWKTAKGVCHTGWKLPSDDDWTQLMSTVGGSQETAVKKLKASSGWGQIWGERDFGNGTDDYGFSALPGGWWMQDDGEEHYESAGDMGFWWTSTEGGYFLIMVNNKTVMNVAPTSFRLSVRCVKEEI